MQSSKIVEEILTKNFDIIENKAFVFGSRATENYRDNSDLDLFIMDKTITPQVMTKLEEDFEQSDLKYKVDIILRSRISDDFYEKIKKDLKPISIIQD